MKHGMDAFKSTAPQANLTDYTNIRDSFQWDSAAADLSFHTTGEVNLAYEAIDRHVDAGRGDHIALHYFDGIRSVSYTFADIARLSNQFANMLRALAVTKGDRVFLFLPRGPELVAALFGTIKVGAIAGPLFEAFMSDAVRDRLQDSGAVALVTTEALLQRIPKQQLPDLKHIIVVGATVALAEGEYSYEIEMAKQPAVTAIEWMNLEDPLYLFYTSGSTGKPKGVVHVHADMIHQYMAAEWVLDLRPDDVYWCTADQGWITGTSMGIIGPWLLGTTIVIRGGRFGPADWYETISRFKVTVWFSAPTAFRMLMGVGADLPAQYRLDSLRHILSAGEPLNPEVLRWAMDAYGQRIHDNWWMTETGAPTISNYPSMPMRLGSMGKPLPGIEVTILDDQGQSVSANVMGNLAIRAGWPAMVRAVWNNPQKYGEYFRFPGWFVTGDSAYVDEDGYYWFQGRVDDVINTAGERIGPFEVESCLLEHPAVAEAGVIGKPDGVRGEIIKAFIALRSGFTASDALKEEISRFVKQRLAAHAAPREIDFKDKLPKTRSGKIMRRVLKSWELGLPVGDLSTMED